MKDLSIIWLLFIIGCICIRISLTDDDDDTKEFDSHGCCLSCGELFCLSNNTCVSDWDSCKLGHYDRSRCQYFYNNSIHEFTYDLSSYVRSDQRFYEITDEVSHSQQQFKYYFNLCSSVNASALPSACKSTTGSAAEVCTGNSLAYQYFSASWGYEACYRLSDCTDSYDPSITDTVSIKYHTSKLKR